MSARFNAVLSDALHGDTDKAVAARETIKNKLLRKALQLYLAALDSKAWSLSLVDPKTEEAQTEFMVI